MKINSFPREGIKLVITVRRFYHNAKYGFNCNKKKYNKKEIHLNYVFIYLMYYYRKYKAVLKENYTPTDTLNNAERSLLQTNESGVHLNNIKYTDI